VKDAVFLRRPESRAAEVARAALGSRIPIAGPVPGNLVHDREGAVRRGLESGEALEFADQACGCIAAHGERSP
jgi:hypothetical protein